MSLYLQRLLDRAAGLTADGPAGLQPAVQSQSPILAFDQRLGDPGLAADFGLLGASPDEPPPMDEPLPGLEPPPLAPRARAPAPAPAPSEAAGRSAAAPAPVPEPRSADPAPPTRMPSPAPPRTRAPAVPEIPGQEPAPEADPAREPRIVPPKARSETPVETAGEPRPRLRKHAASPPAPPVRPAEPRSTPPEMPPLRRAAPIDENVPRPTGPATRPSSDSPVRAAPVVPVADAAIPPRRSVDGPAPVAEPIVASPEAVPPPQQVRRRDIEALVREAMRAETARQPIAPPESPAPARQPPPEGAPETKARRPATAAEASVIGPLERSGFNPMLFGVRRR